MKQNQVESRTDVSESLNNETHLSQSDLNSSSLEEMLLSEVSNAIIANESMELSADHVLNEHVETNAAREEFYPADGSSVPLVSNTKSSFKISQHF